MKKIINRVEDVVTVALEGMRAAHGDLVEINLSPKYLFHENISISQTYASNHPDYQNLANAVAIANYRWGEETTPGVGLAPGTAKCNALYKARGEQPVYQQADHIGGSACDDGPGAGPYQHVRTAVRPGSWHVGKTRQKSLHREA